MEHSLQSGMPFLLRPSDSDTYLPPDTGMHVELRYLRCIYTALPLWAEVMQNANACRNTSSASVVSNLDQRLRELTCTIAEHLLPQKPPESSEGALEVFLIQMQRSMLHCFNNRMIMILHSTLAPFPFSTSDNNAALAAAVDTAEHADAFRERLAELPATSQDAWAHFLVAVFYYQITRAGMHILARVRRILDGRDPTLPPAILTLHGPRHFDLMSLVDFVEHTCGLVDLAEKHSSSAVKWQMFVKGCCAGTRERIRLAGEPTPSPSDGDAVVDNDSRVLQAVKRAMDVSLERSRKEIDMAIRGDDPPPMLCRDEARDGAEREEENMERRALGDGEDGVTGLESTETGMNDGLGAGEGAMFITVSLNFIY